MTHLTTHSSSELLQQVYSATNEEEYWHIISTLHHRTDDSTFQQIKKMASSTDAIEREIAADVLGQLGYQDKTYEVDCNQLLLKLLNDTDIEVMASAAFALGHRQTPEAIPLLLKYLNHPNERLRFGITFGLLSQENEAAIQGLIQLSKDENHNVRNWATFGLGDLCDYDSTELRDALYARLIDNNAEIRGEALKGLAKRQDTRIITYVVEELKKEFEGTWVLKAIQSMPNPVYLPYLDQVLANMRNENQSETLLSEIIETITLCKTT